MGEIFYRGADLIYRLRALYQDTNAVIDPSTFTTITATFNGGGRDVEYTLADSEISIDGNFMDVIIQRADFSSKYRGSWDLVLTTEETDTDFASNKRIRIGRLSAVFNLRDA